MATSSITKNFVISGQKQVEMFADAIEASANDQTSPIEVNATFLTDPQDIARFMEKRKKTNCNAALYSRQKKHFIFDSTNTITALPFR